MAQLYKSVLGKVTGAVGDIVFRALDGKTYLSTRPMSFMPGIDQASVDRRAKFGLAAKISSILNSVPELNAIWKEANPERPAFQNAFRTNYPYIDPTGAAANFKLTPVTGGFGITTGVITVSDAEVQAEINPIGSNAGIDPLVEESICLISFLYLENPTDPLLPATDMRIVKSAAAALDTSLPSVFSIPLLNQDAEVCKLYQNTEAYFALVTFDAAGKPVHFSGTFKGI